MPKKICFVVMGFGEKPDFATSRTLDLDKTYRVIIKKAVEEAGLECIRADDVIHSGTIDAPMYRLLLEADVVVADGADERHLAHHRCARVDGARSVMVVDREEVAGVLVPLPAGVDQVAREQREGDRPLAVRLEHLEGERALGGLAVSAVTGDNHANRRARR